MIGGSMSDDAGREEVRVDENKVCTPENIRSEGNTNDDAEVVDEEFGNFI